MSDTDTPNPTTHTIVSFISNDYVVMRAALSNAFQQVDIKLKAGTERESDRKWEVPLEGDMAALEDELRSVSTTQRGIDSIPEHRQHFYNRVEAQDPNQTPKIVTHQDLDALGLIDELYTRLDSLNETIKENPGCLVTGGWPHSLVQSIRGVNDYIESVENVVAHRKQKNDRKSPGFER